MREPLHSPRAARWPAWPAGSALAVVLGGLLVSSAGVLAAETTPVKLPPAATRTIDFNRDVLPIFQASCFKCHGPEKQRSGFRLDQRESALKSGDAHAPNILLGRSADSPLIHLVAGLVPDVRMPEKGEPLSADQIGILRAWIDQGATWPGANADSDSGSAPAHWAFQPVKRPPVPARTGGTTGHPIDAFINARLAEKKLKPSVEADRVTLIRRLYFVILGLPPSPEDVAAFLADRQPAAFERLVDRVLDDPRYGERWGRHWLDVIRFAESNGFETNRERPNAWRFRDYIIAAFNQDKPYDQFIREQIAGDALGVDVATGYLVGGPVDIVGSPDPVLTSQQRADEVDDMVSTTGTAFLGLTLGCARCHSHKFDPISHREYYAMSAIFAGVRHGDRTLPLPTERKGEIARIDSRIKELEKNLAQFIPIARGGRVPTNEPGASLRPPVSHLANEEAFVPVPAKFVRFIIEASVGEPCVDELEVYAGERNVALATNGTRATASGTLPGYEIHKLEHINDGQPGNSHSWISSESGRGWVQLELPRVESIGRVVWSRDREGRFVDRVAAKYKIEAATELDHWKTVASSDDREPYKGRVDKPPAPVYRFEGWSPEDVARGRGWLADLEKCRMERNTLAKSSSIYAGTFVSPGSTYRLHRGDPMQRRETVAPGTLELFRPLMLSTNAPEQQRRRRLADWVASPDNPLTARVLVNRIWQHHFGVGLVDTPNDFGRNGARPTHPELLDWLASEFVDPIGHAPVKNSAPRPAAGSEKSSAPAKWSIKHLHRLILTSATWRQSSTPREEARHVDASTRLLWRFPPRRLEAEAIRDGILEVSGNLDRKAGGPSFFLHNVDRENVYHYHPKEEFGPEDNRRMVYAFKVRMEQDGIFGAFDCPDGSLVMPRRSVSTTPLQALNLFNSRFILAQSERFAQRLEKEAGREVEAQVRRAWSLAFNRAPAKAELRDAAALARAEGMPALCRAVLNANEFLFVP